jgi:hypothetical protein
MKMEALVKEQFAFKTQKNLPNGGFSDFVPRSSFRERRGMFPSLLVWPSITDGGIEGSFI